MSAIFSVIVPTRNRPELLARSLASIRAQRDAAYEIIVVDDGTEGTFLADLATIEASLAGIGKMIHLAPRSIGHGQSYALNFGAAQSRGDYLCFLDDDDQWTEPSYLSRARACIDASSRPPDLIYFQQRARRGDGQILPGAIWIEDLEPIVARELPAGPGGSYEVDVNTLMRSRNFCHLNTTVVCRDLFSSIGGLSEAVRYENDRDFYLRCIDRAQTILYAPSVVAEHSVPDPARKTNMSTIFDQRERWLAQLFVFNRAALSARHPLIRRFGRLQRGYTKKKMALSFLTEGRPREAWTFALDGLASGFTFKWLAITVLIGFRAMTAAILDAFRV